jgi:hypothetical protein
MKLQTLADTAVRAGAGEEAMLCVRDFLSQIPFCTPGQLEEAIADRPQLTGDLRIDALLAGLAEHIAATRGVACPSWVNDPERFLGRFWFVSPVKAFRGIAIAQTPIALKRRGVFWPARSLERV